ncbi:uncharacterized protein [Aegilops tauschii subsp. strangulata]|uniref:uncharacterized protein n=1 Tax=Aegilops tauschii subsp. strangulata TaxID=200361 RepID=UPI00098A4447|nr:uncharacterized protein LOC109755265 [Aegilops tauschii subsp. strangulata]
MDLLPEDVIGEVLRRLPGRSLAASRGVCRAWRAVVDGLNLLLPHMLPHSVRGIFTNYSGCSRPRFFARPCSCCPGIDAAFDFITPVQHGQHGVDCVIVDHCNGVLLYDDGWYWTNLYVCNPATRRWALLPPPPGDHYYPGLCFAGAYLAFDPAVSLHYEVFLVPDVPEKTTTDDDEEEDPEEGLLEWPPSCYRLQVFSSTAGRWEERAFVRAGEAAGTVKEVRSHLEDRDRFREYSYGEYWRGALYVHCRAGAFVSRYVVKLELTVQAIGIMS